MTNNVLCSVPTPQLALCINSCYKERTPKTFLYGTTHRLPHHVIGSIYHLKIFNNKENIAH